MNSRRIRGEYLFEDHVTQSLKPARWREAGIQLRTCYQMRQRFWGTTLFPESAGLRPVGQERQGGFSLFLDQIRKPGPPATTALAGEVGGSAGLHFQTSEGWGKSPPNVINWLPGAKPKLPRWEAAAPLPSNGNFGLESGRTQ